MTGDVRVRYQNGVDGLDNNDTFDMRAQLKFTAQVAEGTQAGVKFRLGDVEFGNNDSNDVQFYEGYLSHDFGPHVNVTAGRYNQTIGATGYWYDDHVDGAVATVKNGNFWLQGGYARFLEMWLYDDIKWFDADDKHEEGYYLTSPLRVEGGYVQAGYDFGKTAKIQAVYMGLNGDIPLMEDLQPAGLGTIDNVWGVGAGFYMGKFALTGDYMQTEMDYSKGSFDRSFKAVRLQYGEAADTKAGSWDLWVDYVSSGSLAYLGGTGSLRDDMFLEDIKGWGIGLNYMMAQNLKLTAYQTFASEWAYSEIHENGKDKPDSEYTRVQVTYSF